MMLGFLIALAVLQILDLWTTLTALQSGCGVEVNPLLHGLMNRIGVGLTLALKTALVLGIGYWLYSTGALWPLALIDCVYLAVVVNNFQVLRAR